MKELQNDLAPIAHKWYNIGLQLGIAVHDLDKVNREGSDSQRLLNDMLLLWLSNNGGAKKSDLVAMLKSKTIGEAKLARTLLKFEGMVVFLYFWKLWGTMYVYIHVYINIIILPRYDITLNIILNSAFSLSIIYMYVYPHKKCNPLN